MFTSFQAVARRLAAQILILCLILPMIAAEARAETQSRWSGATGGIVRYPNSNQPKDKGNLFGEAWLKLEYRLAGHSRNKLSAFFLGNYVADSTGYAYNNTIKGGVGLSYFWQVSDAFNLTFSARYDEYRQRGTATRRSGMRYAIDYYYYKYWAAPEGATFLGLSRRAAVLKSYGTLAYPGSLKKGDDNLVLTLGAEYSADLVLGQGDWLLTPFVDIDFSWDKDGNSYNNKLVPGVGIKLRKPLINGELFAGVRLQSDFRYLDGTVETSPGVFFGWYKGF